MGYKTLKDHYDIQHIVAIYDMPEFGGLCICIGSAYIHNIIVINISEAKIVKEHKKERISTNEHLDRYMKELKSAEKKGDLKKLIDAPDLFHNNLPVFTTKDWVVISDLCEEYGWPNTTHDGKMMNNNTFFKTQEEAYSYLLKQTASNLHHCKHLFGSRVMEGLVMLKKISCFLVKDCWCWIAARTLGRIIKKSKLCKKNYQNK